MRSRRRLPGRTLAGAPPPARQPAHGRRALPGGPSARTTGRRAWAWSTERKPNEHPESIPRHRGSRRSPCPGSSFDRSDERGAAVPLMGPADHGSASPLMGPAAAGTVTPLTGPADRGAMVSLVSQEPVEEGETAGLADRRPLPGSAGGEAEPGPAAAGHGPVQEARTAPEPVWVAYQSSRSACGLGQLAAPTAQPGQEGAALVTSTRRRSGSSGRGPAGRRGSAFAAAGPMRQTPGGERLPGYGRAV
jgi:hypothetical protein